ncbi:response regulator, partial [bacterium]|nr:response regulator [bacterium]
MYNSDYILVVDDNRDNLETVEDQLKQKGYNVRCVRDGKTALMVANRNPPELMLLDVIMPEMNGYEVCRQLKKNAKTAEFPIIFLSALHEMNYRIKGFDAGGVDYITKPIQKEELYMRVRTHIDLHRSKIELSKHSALLEQRVLERTAELQKSKARFQQLSDLTFEGIIMHKQGVVVDVNKSFCEMFG